MAAQIYKIDDNLFQLAPESQAKIAEAGYHLVQQPCRQPEDIIRQCHDADALIVCIETIDREVLQSLPKLKVVARCGVGVDKVDLETATRLGIQVLNVPDANLHEVATHTMALALALNRRLFSYDRSLRRGAWTGTVGSLPMRRPSTQFFGIVGGGRIGLRVAEIAISVGFNVLVHTLLESDQARARALGATLVSFEELILQSDILTLHIPLLESTRNILSDDVMQRMKPGAYLINVSRGGLVDEQALIRHLDAGHLAGAALDVFDTEPVLPTSKLVDCPGLILTPHVAYLSSDSNQEVIQKAVDGVIAVLQGDNPMYPVNRLSATRGQ